MKKGIFKIVFWGGMILFIFSGIYMYMAYEEFTCHGCMSVPSLNIAEDENSLVAVYKCDSVKSQDTLYLTQGGIHGGGYHYYSEDYFVGYKGVLDKRIFRIESLTTMASVINGEFSSYTGIKEIPKEINCKDSTGNIIYTFNLIRSYPENIELGSKKSYLKEWKTIIQSY